MKSISKVIATIASGMAISTSSFGQTATPAATNIVTPISIIKNVDMDFGNMAVSASRAGTVVLTPTGSRTTGGAGGVTLPSATGKVASADFTVAGQPSYTYTISLPAAATLNDGSGHKMTVNAFSSIPANTGALSARGTQDIKVGATLNVTAAQSTGVYTNSTAVPVTVNYN